ncbi:MAG: hypothetical protein ACOVP1_13105, partial [Bacteroidia bacterium]
AWFERTEKKYGKKGIVLSFKILNLITYKSHQETKGKYFAVLSYTNQYANELNSNSKGLVQLIELKDSNLKNCYLSIWENKEEAISYFKSKPYENEYYEVPLILNNVK